MRRSSPGVGWGALLTLALTGCGVEARRPAPSVEVRDSSGVNLIHNVGTPEEFQAALLLEVRPDPGIPETLFGRIADVRLTREGGIAVLDGQASHVVLLDDQGQLVGTLGGPGEGPGELSSFANSLLVHADTLLVSDWLQGRWARYTVDGTLFSHQPLPDGWASTRSWWQSSPNGADLWGRTLRMTVGDDGLWVGRDLVARSRGGVLDTVAVFDYPRTSVGGRENPRVPLVLNTPLWAPLVGGGLVWTTLEGSALRVLTPEGALTRAVSASDWTRTAASDLDHQRLREKMADRLSTLGGDPSALDVMPVDLPDSLPAITSLRTDDGGRIWVQLGGSVEHVDPSALNTPDPPTAWGGPLWDVLDSGGQRLHRLRFPEGFRLLDLAGNRAAGVLVTELGEEFLAIFEVPHPDR